MNKSRRQSCAGKHRHPSEGAALAQLRSLIERRQAKPHELAVYFCVHCRHYHVGHPAKTIQDARAKGNR